MIIPNTIENILITNTATPAKIITDGSAIFKIKHKHVVKRIDAKFIIRLNIILVMN